MNVYLLSPVISLCGLAIVVILLDLFLKRKWILGAVSVAGLIVPAAFTLALWGREETSFNGMLAVDEFSLFFNLFLVVSAALVIHTSIDYVYKFNALQGG